MAINPCLSCGACCAFFRASFYWAEANDESPGGVPVELTVKLNNFRRAMIGSSGSRPRCIALQGAIGKEVSCAIYECRASVCRDFQPAWRDGIPNPRCDEARLAWGLPVLDPLAWGSNFPRVASATSEEKHGSRV